MKKKKIKKAVIIVPITILLIIILLSFFIQANKNVNASKTSLCSKYSIYGNITYDKDKKGYMVKNITYCDNFDISKYKEISATLFEKDTNTINEISTYEYKENTAVLLDKFLTGLSFNGTYSKSICEKYKKDTLYFEVKVITFDNKVDLINIPLIMEEKCKWLEK